VLLFDPQAADVADGLVRPREALLDGLSKLVFDGELISDTLAPLM
jgi:hypothetical protein